MANLTGPAQAFHSDTSIVDTTQVADLGMRAWDDSGNEYIYLSGVSSTSAGSWVTYNENYATTLLVANAVGPVAIAMATVDATTKYGWYQIFGKNTVAKSDTIAADKALFIDGTSGRVDDLGVAGDLVIGAYSMTADSSNVATVFINYPHVSDDLGAGAAGVGGSDTQVQFNDGGSFGGDSGLTYNKTTDVLTVAGAVNMETANIEDSDASHYLVLKTTSDLTANRNFTIVPGDSARTLTMAGNINIAADFITSGANSLTLTTSGATNVTLPTTGTLATLAGTETLSAKTLTAPKFANAGFIADANGNELIIFTTTASAVNELTFANGSTGVNPKFTASGETNVGLDFQAKGTGTYRLLGTSDQAAELRLYEDTDNGTNYSAFKVGSQSADITYTLPTAVGGSGTFLKDAAGNGVLSWATPSGGGGQIAKIPFGSVVLPNTNFPACGRVVGTNFSYQTFDFDQTTSEAMYMTIPIEFTPTSAAKIGVWWTAASGTGTFTVDFDWRSLTDGEVLDGTTVPSTTNDTATDTLLATGTVHYVEVTLTNATSAIAAGDLLVAKFSRDVADTLNADARVVDVVYFST